MSDAKNDWRIVSLGDLIALQRGHDLPTISRRPGRVPVIGSGGITGWHDTAVANGPGITIGRAANLGVPTRVQDDFWPLNTTLYVTDFRGNDVDFVYYLLRTLDLTGYDSGSVQPMLNRNYIRRYQLRIPLPPEQRAISAVLRALDDKITVNERIANTTQELAQLVFSRATQGAHVSRLDAVAAITMGSSPPGYTYNEVGEGLPFYQGVRDFGVRTPNVRVWCSAPVRTAEPGDVLVSVRAPVGRVNAARERCCIGRGLAATQARFDLRSTLFHAARAIEDAWQVFDREGTVFGAINRDQLAGIHVPWLEDLEAQSALETKLRALDSRADAAVVENRALAQLRDTLLPRLMSGELRIKDAERMVSDAI